MTSNSLPDDLDNVAIISLLLQGDEQCFSTLYKHYHNAVYSNILKLVHNSDDAEDLLQEVFVQLWNDRMQLSEKQQIGGWLFLTSYYKSLAHLKKNIHVKLLNLEEVGPDYTMDDTENTIAVEQKLGSQVKILESGIKKLPHQIKLAFILCRQEGWSYAEAAEELGVTAETVKEYIRDATKRLQRYALANKDAIPLSTLFYLLVYIN